MLKGEDELSNHESINKSALDVSTTENANPDVAASETTN